MVPPDANPTINDVFLNHGRDIRQALQQRLLEEPSYKAVIALFCHLVRYGVEAVPAGGNAPDGQQQPRNIEASITPVFRCGPAVIDSPVRAHAFVRRARGIFDRKVDRFVEEGSNWILVDVMRCDIETGRCRYGWDGDNNGQHNAPAVPPIAGNCVCVRVIRHSTRGGRSGPLPFCLSRPKELGHLARDEDMLRLFQAEFGVSRARHMCFLAAVAAHFVRLERPHVAEPHLFTRCVIAFIKKTFPDLDRVRLPMRLRDIERFEQRFRHLDLGINVVYASDPKTDDDNMEEGGLVERVEREARRLENTRTAPPHDLPDSGSKRDGDRRDGFLPVYVSKNTRARHCIALLLFYADRAGPSPLHDACRDDDDDDAMHADEGSWPQDALDPSSDESDPDSEGGERPGGGQPWDRHGIQRVRDERRNDLSHYFYITDFSRFMATMCVWKRHRAHDRQRRGTCCFSCLTFTRDIETHERVCLTNKTQKVCMPDKKDAVIEFRDQARTVPLNTYIVYDFETYGREPAHACERCRNGPPQADGSRDDACPHGSMCVAQQIPFLYSLVVFF